MGAATGFILDTSVLVALIRGNPLGQRIDAEFRLQANLNRSMIPVITVGELHALSRKLGWQEKKRKVLASLLADVVWIDINHREVFEAYAEIDYYLERVVKPAQPVGQNDLWIAATARAADATLLTTDRDFDPLQGQLIDRIWIDPNMA